LDFALSSADIDLWFHLYVQCIRFATHNELSANYRIGADAALHEVVPTVFVTAQYVVQNRIITLMSDQTRDHKMHTNETPADGAPLTEGAPSGKIKSRPDEPAQLYETISGDRELLRQLLVTSADCVKVLDVEGRVLFMNESSTKLLEIENPLAHLHTLWTSWWEGDAQRAAENAIAEANAGGTARFEARARTEQGALKWWVVMVAPIRGADGKSERLLVISRDVTGRKKSEENLRASEEQFRAAFDQSVMGMALTDVNGVILKANEAFLRIVGRSVDEVAGRDSRHMTHPEDQANNVGAINALKTGERASQHFNKRYIRKDGSIVWTQVTLSRVSAADGKPLSLIATVEDITEQKNAQQALLEKEQHLRLIFESAKDYAIFTTGPDGVVSSWNTGAERAFGYRASEILGQNAALLWTPEDQANGGPAKEMEAALRTGVAEDKRWHMRKDGTRFFASGMLRPLLDEAGNLRGFTKVCRDVTMERAAEDELTKARAQLALSVEAERSRLAELFHRSPSFMAVLRGQEHVFELTNDQYYHLVGRRDIIGKPLREALPEVVEQGFVEKLDRVYQAGEAFVGNGARVMLQRESGRAPVARYMDFVFQPMRDIGGVVTGIFVHGVETTERELAAITSRRLAAIVDSSDDAIASKDLDSIVKSWNAAAERIFGYTAEEIIGTSIKRIIPPDRESEEDDILARIARGERVDHLETIRMRKDGQLINVSVTISPIKDSTGKVIGASKVARDITERKRSEEKLRASEERFRQLWATTTDAIVVMDAEERVQYANPAVHRIFGYSEQELIAHGMRVIMPEKLREKHTAGMRRYLSTGERKLDWRATEMVGLHRDGHEFPIEISFSHFQENGQDRFAAFIRDISERKHAQEALQRSEALFRQLADSMPNIVWAARPDGYVDYYNRRWYEFTGLPEDADGNERWESVIHPADLQRTQNAWARSLRTGEPYEIEFRYRRAADGSYRWHLGRALPAKDATEEIVRWFGTSTDIHDQKQLQHQNEQLLDSERAARGEAERASRMKDEFLATLSHELRTPLNAILGWAQILRDAADLKEVREGIEVIERNARAQTQIIEDLLDMSRIISGKVRIDVQHVNVAPIVQAAVESVRLAADAKGVRLQTVFDSMAGPVSGDPNRLQQVFWNLLSNAVKFTPRGGRVQVVLERVNSHLDISVIDTGEGIKPEFLPHVFDRFRQADATTTRKHGGLGLGLAIVKQLVELHGGTIRVKSGGIGQGAAFTVTLPVMPIQIASESTGQRHHPHAIGNPAFNLETCLKLNGVKVLVVDDEPDARALVKRLLDECEALVRTAGSADEAMTMIQEEIPDVLVSDIGMPDEDGYSLIRRVRAIGVERGGRVPAVALTAYARAEDRMKAILAGFQMHVPKPVEGAELLTMIASLAGRTPSV
jgi:PAS domain S-box-containing protein